jgi:hypothetical protein
MGVQMGYKKTALGVQGKPRLLNLAADKFSSAAARDKAYKLSDGDGMYMLVHPNGAKYWRLKYRLAGKERVYSIGVYPEVSLAEARRKRDTARKLIQEGVDPTIDRRVAKATATTHQATDFKGLAEEWFGQVSPGYAEQHLTEQRRRLDVDILPYLGAVPLKDIKPALVLETLRRIEARGALETALKCRILISQVFRYAVITSRADADPAALLQGALKVRPPVKHRATVAQDDMASLFVALQAVH